MMDSSPLVSLVDLLLSRAAESPDRESYLFLTSGEVEGERLTCGELSRRARAIGALLARQGEAGERVLLLYPPGVDFIAAFFGCLLGGAIAVPAYPPRSERHQPRLSAIARDARPSAVLAPASLVARSAALEQQVPELSGCRWLATDALPAGLAEEWTAPRVGPETPAFLQYTSGSTATPKGVVVRHGNLLENERLIARAFGMSERSVTVGWLPLYHDMGLIGNVLQPLYSGGRCILFSPLAFLQRPLRWLQAISRYRATTSGGPNFAYDLCVRRIGEAERETLDLTSWTLAFNGSEPVRAETLERFAAAFAPCGFDPRAFFPCYGLAEATLFVAGGGRGAAPAVATLEAAALEQGRVAAAGSAGRRLVGCASPGPDLEIAIVDPETGAAAPPGRVGEIWVGGPSVAAGYWQQPEETERSFHARTADGRGPYLRTGDLGFLDGGTLFITGRLKDLIILRGRNLYPQDLERTVEESHPALRAGCSAAFAVDRGDGESLALACEIERGGGSQAPAIFDAIRRAVAEEHEVSVQGIVLLPPGTIPKTSSGKIQRRATRERYLAGDLPAVAASAGPQETPEPPEPALTAAGAAELSGGELDAAAVAALLRDRLAALLRRSLATLAADVPLSTLGLDSLAAAELQALLERELGVEVEVADLLSGPTLGELTARVLARRGPRRRAPEEVEPAAVSPLSHGQRALWFADRLWPGGHAYTIAAAARIFPAFDLDALSRALALVAARHEALCLRFEEGPRGPVQRVDPDRVPELTVFDAAGWSAGRLDAALAALAQRPFDLSREPLLRLAVFRTGEDEDTVLFAIHHIVADLGSVAILLRDLTGAYARLRAGEAVTSLPPAPRFTDHVRREAERLDEALAPLLDFWRAQLAAAPPATEIAPDRPRPPVQTHRGAARSLGLPEELLARAQELAREEGATLYAVLLAAFDALLARATGQDDLLVGSPTSGRGPAELADLVGYLVNPLVLRTRLGDDPGFRELLARVRGNVLSALRHQALPFPLLVERLEPQRDPSRSPFFQILFTFERSHLEGAGDLGAFALGEEGAATELPGLALRSVRLPASAAQFDLELIVAPLSAGLGLRLVYNADLFDGATAARLLGHFAVLLEAAVDEPGRPISQLAWLTPAERHQLRDWNDTAVPSPAESGFLPLFDEQARRTPDALAVGGAVSGESRRLTYGELAAAASRLAAALVAAGLRPEEPVALLAERGPGFLAALLGILKAGGAYLPLDPRQPEPRLAQMARQAGVRLSLAAAPFAGLARAVLGAGGEILPLDSPPRRADLQGELAPPLPDRLAYVLFTSGSTGAPKGAMVAHRGLANHLFAKVRDLGLRPADRIAQTAAPSFDISVWQFLAALTVGAAVEVFPDEVAADPARLLGEVERRGVTVLETVPSLLAALLAAPEALPPLAALRWLIPTGEALPPELGRQWLARFPHAPVLNAYGPTECSDDVSHHALFEPLPAGAATTPIGRPIANLRLHVLGRDLTELPIAIPGEIGVAGAGVGRGYLGDPARTAAAFVPDPAAGAPGGRLYRTGDLGRRRADGDLEFLGRFDHQVKVRGFRIELGEIEAALSELPGVAQAVVVLRRDPRGEERLAAYWAAIPAGPPPADAAADALREGLRERLPEAMIPAAFVQLPSLPRTANGKVDRRALPEPDWRGPERPERAAAAHDAVSEILAGIFAEVLGHEAVAPDESFFEIGGHSLLATQVAARVRRALGVELPLASLFEAPTAAALAARLRSQGAAAPPLPPPRRAGASAEDTAGLPLSFGQQRLWLLSRLEPESAAYNMPGEVRLRGHLDPAALAAALAAAVERHQILRTVFRDTAGVPRQEILAAPEARLPQVDLSGLPAARRAGTAAALAAAEGGRPFDLERGPLVRALLVRLDTGEHRLLAVLHHIVADGWSQAILVRELEALYRAAVERRAPDLPELPLQYADYARWQVATLTEERLAEGLAYFRARLQDLPALALPTDRPRPARQSYRGARRPFRLGARETAALRRLARQEGATLFMALSALFGALLSRLSGQLDFALGTPVANRPWPEVEGLLGFFVNTLALRADLRGRPGFAALLGRSRDATLGALAHQDLPFERLVEELEPVRDLGRPPLFQVMLAFQNVPVARFALPGLELALSELDNGTAKFDLTLSLEEEEGALAGWFERSTDLFDAVTIDRLGRRLARLLGAAAAEPERPFDDLPLLAPEESQQLREWNDTAASLGRDLALHEWVAEQAARTPDAVAVVCEGAAMSYAELDTRAGELARALLAHGVGPETVVGALLERSLALPVALLGILRAGGAYLPLDPSYPRERLAQMLADTAAAGGAPVVVAEAGAASLLPPGSARIVPLGSPREGWGPFDLGPLPRTAPGGLAYVIFTSGSTGRPKGAMNSHRAILNRLRWMAAAHRIGPGDRVLQKTPLSFDISVWEIFLPLGTGACLVLARPGGHQDAAYLARTLAREGVTVAHFVPSMLQAFLEHPDAALGRGLTRVVASGEALPPALAERFSELLPGVLLDNLYGPTEAAVEVTAWPWDAAAPRRSVPIGRPVANTSIQLLDDRFRAVLPGVAGELAIGGVQVGRGYLSRPDLTAERFTPDPLGGEPGARLYRTGDLARHLADGAIEFLGRLDSQVKIRGFRIELQEVEAALAEEPGVREAAVVAWPGSAGDLRLIAYLSGEALSAEALRQGLARRLPAFMIPASFVLLPALPLTPSGKLDRRALPPPEWEGSAFVAPRDPVEAAVAGIWADLLGVSRVGVLDSFFVLGGHSLLALRALSRVQEALGVELPLRSLFEAPTLADFAAAVSAARRGGLPPPAPIPRLPREGPLPASFAQERFWVMDQLLPGNPVFNVSQALEIDGPLDVAALAAAFFAVVRRHETLRTRFTTVHGRPYQVVEPAAEAPLKRLDLTALPAGSGDRELARLAREAARAPFDLRTGPLLRLSLVQLGPVRRVLLLAMHHAICDDWSIGLFVDQVAASYRAAVAGRTAAVVALPAPAVQYADYAQWQREETTAESLAQDLAYWRRQLGGDLPVLDLPTDRPRPPAQSFAGAAEPFAFPPQLLEALRQTALREGATLFMVLLAGFAAVLHAASGQPEIVVGSPVAGRGRREVEDLIGCFVNILPLRVDLSGRPTYRELLRRVRQSSLGAYDHQGVPFERLVEVLQPRRDLGRPALRQVALSFQETSRRPIELGPGIGVRPFDVEAGVSRLDLTLFAWAGEEGLSGYCEYSTALFERRTIRRLLEHLRATLDDLAAGVLRPLLALPPLRAAEPAEPADAAAPEPPAGERELTESQLLFWFARKLQPDVDLYFDSATATFTLEGDLDPGRFAAAFQALVAGCDSLRTRVREVDGLPRRSVGEAGFPFEVLDFSAAGEPGKAAAEWLARRSAEPLDLAVRLVDSALLRLAAGRFLWFVKLHHMIADGWSLALLAQRLSELYRLAGEGRLAEAPPLPSFEEYALHERAHRGSDAYQKARLYWERKLARPPAPLPLYARPSAPPTLQTARQTVVLGPARSAEIAAAASGAGSFSSSVLFLSALCALLYRLSGERHLRLATPFANRPFRFRNVVGLLMNACPLDVEIAAGETFGSLARKVQREVLDAARHQPYPVRHPAEGRAFEVYFNFQAISFPELCGLPVHFELLHSGFSNDRLHLQVSDFDAQGNFRLDFDFHLGSFSPAERERTRGHYLALLGAAGQEDLPIAAAPLLGAAERQAVVSEWNDTATALPAGLTLDRLLAAQIERSAAEIAVAAPEGALTYRQLGQRSRRLARYLRASGVGPDVLVGVAMERSLDLVVALVGILAAGGAYVPIDPSYPPERVAMMLEDARVPLLLTQERLAGPLRASGARLVCLDSGWDAIAACSEAPLPPWAVEESLAYVIFTSGSTGRPKGAMLPHRGIVNRLLWMQEAYGLGPDDRVLQKTPVSFDVSVWELFWPLLAGARLVMAAPGGHQDPSYLLAAIEREGITTLHFVPSMLQLFLEQPGLAAGPRLARLARVVASGEALPPALCRRFHERLSARLENLYGPTEASVDVTFWHSAPGEDAGIVPIGRPIANTAIHLLGRDLEAVPPGIAAELLIGGVGLARGYLRRPDLTAERFIPDPFATVPGARLYRTGDLARHLPDGNVLFLGRSDHQVKIRGVRIELGEIESALAAFPGVREAVVTVREDRPGDRRLTAYFVAEPGWGPAAAQLRGYLRTRLPEAMVPAAFVPLPAMPLTPSGKVDRRALPAPEAEPQAGPARTAPRTTLEALIASVCAEVLGQESVDIFDNFFDLGGNSLLATQVVTMLREVLPITLDLRRVFESPTVAKLAEVVEAEGSTLGEREQGVMAEILAEFAQALEEGPASGV